MTENETGYEPGLELIREMSKEDIINELLEAQRLRMVQRKIGDLKNDLVQLRLAFIQKRMYDEAGLELHGGAFGTYAVDPEAEEGSDE
jgi:hypothetical protein